MKQNEELAKSVLNAIDDDVLNAAEMEMTEGGKDINGAADCSNENCGNCGNCFKGCGSSEEEEEEDPEN